ncbi:MAG: hypothetical protein J07HX64_02007 [halophilic archaeon J07HX64]|nr:MAG: hypothetical protein J07HX64_02007 [halophilic archaeon J07HX64]
MPRRRYPSNRIATAWVYRTMTNTENRKQDGERDALLPLERRTYLMSLAAGASATGGAAGGTAAASDGTVEQENTAEKQNLEDTWVGYGRGEYGSGLYGDVGPPAISSGPLPTDPDNDGLFENVNGDGEFSIFDVQTFFQNFEKEEVQRYAPFYNFSGDDDIDVTIFDVQSLFVKLANR